MAVIKYRAYKTYNHDKVRDLYDAVDLFEMEAIRLPFSPEITEHYDQEYPDEPILMLVGEDDHVSVINRDLRFVGESVVAPISLKIKTYYTVPAEDLSILESETKDAGDTWVGEIKGIVPIREILQGNQEEFMQHPVIEDRDATIKDPSNNNVYSGEFVQRYMFPSKCLEWNCPFHRGDLMVFNKKKWFIVGLPEIDGRVIQLRQKKKRIERLQLYERVLNASMILTKLDMINASPEFYAAEAN